MTSIWSLENLWANLIMLLRTNHFNLFTKKMVRQKCYMVVTPNPRFAGPIHVRSQCLSKTAHLISFQPFNSKRYFTLKFGDGELERIIGYTTNNPDYAWVPHLLLKSAVSNRPFKHSKICRQWRTDPLWKEPGEKSITSNGGGKYCPAWSKTWVIILFDTPLSASVMRLSTRPPSRVWVVSCPTRKRNIGSTSSRHRYWNPWPVPEIRFRFRGGAGGSSKRYYGAAFCSRGFQVLG